MKGAEFLFDSQTLFYFDSATFLRNALRTEFIPYRSYTYGGLIGIFAAPLHSLRAIVAMQVLMGGVTAWLLAFALIRFLQVRPWIGILAALLCAVDPEQVVHEHLVLPETTALLAEAVFLVAALGYLRSPAKWKLVALSFLGVVLVSLRIVYLPVVLAFAVLLPISVFLYFPVKRPRQLALALALSCLSAFAFQEGYQHLTGWLAGREPAYHYTTGFFLLSAVSPLLLPADAAEPLVAAAIGAQRSGSTPLTEGNRVKQMWNPEGLIAKVTAIYRKDERSANLAAHRVADTAIRRNPLGYLELGARTWCGFWTQLARLRRRLRSENGMSAPNQVKARDAAMIRDAFSVDVSNQFTWATPSRRYHIAAAYWQMFLLLAPFLAGLAWGLQPANPPGVALLFVWTMALLAATCLGACEPVYRYLHPFAFPALAGGALLLERWRRPGVRHHA